MVIPQVLQHSNSPKNDTIGLFVLLILSIQYQLVVFIFTLFFLDGSLIGQFKLQASGCWDSIVKFAFKFPSSK